eukprot:m.5261 g.5261  ORF g.5261 m.5261 type:complete len:1143 (+) comp2368_c0_seq1:79-3507(+)
MIMDGFQTLVNVGSCGKVKVLGLDVENNVRHQLVWEEMKNLNQNENASLSYELCQDPQTCFPKRKAKPQRVLGITEEDYIPPGIIKLNWMKKHAQEIPAVVVVFIPLEWEAENWNDREQQCGSLFNLLRAKKMNRCSRIVAILEQSVLQRDVPQGVIDERAFSFRNVCDLQVQGSLFTLDSPNDHISAAMQKLQDVFADLSRQHYAGEVQRVQAHLDIVNHSTEHVLLVRYLFKIGFFGELRKAYGDAVSYYSRALAYLTKVQPTSRAHHTEIKSIRSLLSLRMCGCFFLNSKPSEAISRFATHIGVFKRTRHKDEPACEHHAWIAQQYSTFGQMFHRAVEKGIGVLMLQHPGFYFKFAAEHVEKRRKLAASSSIVNFDTLSAPAVSWKEKTYIGQGFYTTETPVALSQDQLIILYEKQQPLPSTILNLLTRARDYFSETSTLKVGSVVNGQMVNRVKKLKKMVSILDLQRAQQLISLLQYQQAARLLWSCTVEFRQDSWNLLLKESLHLSRTCAWALGDSISFCSSTLELCSPSLTPLQDEREELQGSIVDLISGENCKEDSLFSEESNLMWASSASQNKLPSIQPLECSNFVSISTISEDGKLIISNMNSVIDCKVVLFEPDATQSNRMHLCVMFYSNLSLPITMSNLEPQLQFSEGDADLLSLTTAPSVIALLPTSIKYVDLWITPPEAVSTIATVSCVGINATLAGTKPISMTWDTSLLETRQNDIISSTASHFSQHSSGDMTIEKLSSLKWKDVPTITTMTFLCKHSGISLAHSHTPPLLVGEKYPIAFVMTNDRNEIASDVRIDVRCMRGDSEAAVDELVIFGDGATKKATSTAGISLGLENIQGNGKKEFVVFVSTGVHGRITLIANVFYTMAGVGCETTNQVEFPVTVPLQIDVSFRDTQGQVLDLSRPLVSSQTILVIAQIGTAQPTPLVLENAFVKGKEGCMFSAMRLGTQKEILVSGEECRETIPIPLSKLIGSSTSSLGAFCMQWKRLRSLERGVVKEDSNEEFCETVFTLPMVDIVEQPLNCVVQCPSSCKMDGEGFQVILTIENTSMRIHEVEVEVINSPHFVISGHQRLQLKILPNQICYQQGIEELVYHVIPLNTGICSMFKFKVRDVASSEKLLVDAPSSILVLP